MTQHQSYQEQAGDHYREQRWQQRLLAARVPRSLVIRGGTLAALGGASAVAQILAACAGGAARDAGLGGATAAEGAFKYSRFVMIEKYNWRLLPWGGTPYVDGSLSMSGSGPSNWDFMRRSLTSYGQVMDNLLNKRYGAGADMELDELEGHLADRWSHAPDYSYFDYHIRPNVYFHDIAPVNGRLCTAEDVKYCLDAYKAGGLAAANLAIVDRVEVLADKETVRVYPKRPVLFMDWTMSSNDFYIFAREHFEGPKLRWEQQPIGIGPFQSVFHESGNRWETVRNERYNRPDSRWAGYRLPFLKEFKQTALAPGVGVKAALRSGQIDFTSITDFVDFQDLSATNPEFKYQIYAPNTTYGSPWAFQYKDPLFQDIRVRRALNLAINRREMIETVTGGMGSASHPIGYTWMGRRDPWDPEELGPWQQYNPELAKQLLTEAGYANGFELELALTGTPTSRDVMTEQYLAAIGVRLKFNTLESTVLTNTRTTKNFKHAITHTAQTGYDPVKLAREWFLPDSPRNWGSYNDPVMTDLVERATYTLNPDEQTRLIKQIHERSLDQCYGLEFFVQFTIHVRNPWLHNIASAVQGYFNAWGYHQVSVAWIDDKAPVGRAGRLKA